MSALIALTQQLGEHFGLKSESQDLIQVLKATAFKGQVQVNDAQMTALMVVASQYKLNPFTKEIYAFPDKGGIVPVVGVDGWARIINDHAMFDGMTFEQDAESCTCIMYRKDRNHPIRVTEYMAECNRKTGPWTSHPKRMLRHKATIQCARLAFGFVGIYDPDEAERIAEANGSPKQSGRVIEAITREVKHFDLQAALAEVARANTHQEAREIYMRRGKEAVDAEDTAGQVALKNAVIERRHAIDNNQGDNQ